MRATFERMFPELEGTTRISLRGLRVHARVGVLPHERAGDQPLNCDVSVWVALRQSESDEISHVLDYRGIRERVIAILLSSHTNLLETLCNRVAACLLEFEEVRAARVLVEKPNAFDDVEAVGIEVFHFKDPA